MAGNVIDEFFVALGFEVEKEGVTEFEKQLRDVAKTAAKVTAAIAAAVGGVIWFTANTAYAVDELGDFAEREDVAVDSLSAFGHAAQIAGSSLEAVMKSVEGVNRTIGEASLGIGRGKTAFKDLGLEARNSNGEIKTSFELIDEVADRFKTLSQQESIAMAEKLGIDRSLIPLLKKGAAGIAELTNEARAFGVVTSEQAALAGDLTDSLDRSKFVFGSLQRQLASALMPTLLRISNEVRGWVVANRDLIKTGIERFVRVATFATNVFLRAMLYLGRAVNFVVVQLDDLVQWLTTTKTGMLVLTVAMSTLTGMAIVKGWQLLAGAILMASRALLTFLANPVVLFATLLGGVIIAVGLLVDDIRTWMNGGDSLVGRWLGSWGKVRDGVMEVWDAFSAFVSAVVGLFLGPLVNAVKGLVGAFVDIASAIWSGLASLSGFIWDAVKLYFSAWAWLFDAVIGALGTFGEVLLSGWSAIWGNIGGTVKAVGDFILGIVDSLIDRIAGLRLAINAAKRLGSVLSKVFGSSDDPKPSPAVVQAANDQLQGLPPAVVQAVNDQLQGVAPAQPANAATSPTNGQAALSVGGATDNRRTNVVNTTTNVGDVKIDVKSTDPIGAAKEINRELSVLMRNTRRNTQNGVAV